MTPKFRRRCCRTLVLSSLWLIIFFPVNEWAASPSIAFLVAAAIVSASYRWWKTSLCHFFTVRRFAAVIPGHLYRSGQISRFHIRRVLRRHRIRAVIDLTSASPGDCHKRVESAAITKAGIIGYRFPMRGNGTGELSMVADAVTALHRHLVSEQPVLVHCAAGVQRTGHVLSAYLLLVAGADPTAVYQYMERFGWEPSRSSKWPAQLNENMRALAEILVERRVIPSMPEYLPRLPSARPDGLKPWWLPSSHLISPVLGR
ncbi:MAG: hypothetical protein CMK32_00940 [Porticoccaceae bacterium]|nr:hypothetical protein [Porticoccaceae bacterium]